MSRDRAVDAVRAWAVGGVVLGHWLVTALVLAPDGGLTVASPLATMPALAPATWLFQTLGLLFFAAGYAATRSRARFPGGGAGWLARRMGRLALPTLALLGGGAAVLLAAIVLGAPDDTLATAIELTISPLWFLLPLLALSALTGALHRAVRRWGAARCVALAVAVAVAADLAGRLAPVAPGRLPVALLAAWSVPWLLGVAHADGRLTGRRPAVALAAGGAVALGGLLLLGWPASAVGVPGADVSNLHPPSSAAVALAMTQVGLALLARPALERLVRRAAVRRAVDGVNRHAMGIYLCHQPVLIGVTALAARAGLALPGLHTPPASAAWLAARLGWLPLFALVLAGLLARRRPRVSRVAAAARRPATTARPGAPARPAGCTMIGVAGRCVGLPSGPRRPQEVIAVRDSDPPSRGRADRQPR
ncbi:acyltransferase family protein [Micromonospora sp. PLK6-60]|uniref:acyltransferase family protein n=1 Tax=Micromonospora sp. PLK6-60 TaxID=2873383 RepID=UPI001CA5FA3F|nr:acyltransferase family protein [Micromonospora sp. PLK6-60]MBY8872536.1 acyltransferase family protein [Micromonospora sp. PLK6-60]